MNDDETLPDAPPIEVAPETPAPAATKADRRKWTIDRAIGGVHGTEGDGSTIGTFLVANYPPISRAHLELEGLRSMLRNGDPKKVDADLTAGELPSSRAVAPSGLDSWREAYAYALADIDATSHGFPKVVKGKETPAYTAALDEARETARKLSKDGLLKAKKVAAVVAHHERITGASVSLADLA